MEILNYRKLELIKNNMKRFYLVIGLLITMEGCDKGPEKTITTENNSDTLVMKEKNLKMIKSAKCTNVSFPEFTMWNTFAVVEYNEGKISKVSALNELTDNEPVKELSVNYEGEKISKEFYINYKQPHLSDTLVYKVNGEKEEAVKGEVPTEIFVDTLGHITKRVDYLNSDKNNIAFYYNVRRDIKGNEQESIAVNLNVEDAEITKTKYEYIEFDENGNWTKRKRLNGLSVADMNEFEDFFYKNVEKRDFQFPVELGETPDETIEEREIIYE
jgi:hypothetical protein